MSTLAFLIAAAIFCCVACGMEVGSLVPEELEALARSLLMSASRAETLTPERMCVVSAPPTVSDPTTEALVSQSWGLIPSADRPPPPWPDPPTEEKLDSSRWKSAAGSWYAVPLRVT